MPVMFSQQALAPYTQAIAQQGTAAAPTAVAAQPSKGWFDKIAEATFWGGNGLDLATTAYAIAHGAHETDPIYTWAGQKAALPMIAAENIGGYWLLKKLLKNHPTMQRLGLLAAGGIHAGAGIHNLGMLAQWAQQAQPPHEAPL